MTRLAAWVCLALLALPAAGQDLTRLLKGVEARYNRARTLQVLFQQSYSVQGHRRRTESGELSLRKPGRMRWEYSSPKGKLFLSDGKFLYLYTPDDNRVEKAAVKESDDMRAPLAFLLGKLDFNRDFRRFLSKRDGAGTRITAEPKSDQLPYTRVEFVVTPAYEIRYLHITGQDHSVMEFAFSAEKVNPPMPDKLFRFQMPAGAELVESTQGGN